MTKDNEKITILREETYPVKGTTKLHLWDGGFPQPNYDLEFDGNISAAPLGRLRIREQEHEYDFQGENLKWTEYEITVTQAMDETILDMYAKDRYYPNKLKKQYTLNCETAAFDMETKFGYDHFHTGADGYYADLLQMKQHYGMILSFSFDSDLFSFDELKDRFFALFPKRKLTSAKKTA